MILRLLLTIVLIVLLVILFKRVVKALNNPRHQNRIEQYADTVTCHKCGVRLIKQDAIQKNGQYYCCEEHTET